MNRRHDDDADLVERALEARGDLRPFEELVKRHEHKVLANCRFITGSPDDAQDLAQEVFVKAFFGLKSFRAEARFGTWVQRIKVNHCLNYLRKRKDKTFIDVEDPVHHAKSELQVEPDIEVASEAGDRKKLIAAALDLVPETLRIPLVMRDLDEMSYREIADQLGLGLSAVKMRIKRGREEFRSVFTRLNEDS